MMDWADECALEFLNSLDAHDLDHIHGCGSPYSRLASALRKAKADGMREALDMTVNGFGWARDSEIPGEIKRRADEIEKGQEWIQN